MLSDEKLLTLLKKGNALAFDELFNRYWALLFKSADKLLLDEDAAKDVVQEIFVDLWKRRETLQVSNLKAYLLQAVKYQIVEQLRKGKFTERHEERLISLHFSNATEEMVMANELYESLERSLQGLPDRCYEIFLMSRFENLSNREIANRLNISIRTVETQISNALRYLRRTLPAVDYKLGLFALLAELI